MIKLTIYRADGSVYWVEHFNLIEEAEVWLADEVTRPYWDPAFTHELIDETPQG